MSWRRSKAPWRIYLLLFLTLVSIVSSARAGDLKVNPGGTITNTGTIRIKNNASGLPMINGGVYEFLGSNQTIPPMQYLDLKLGGTGTKTFGAGTPGVNGTFTVASGVTAVTPAGSQLNLQGTLDEQGYVLGTIDKTVNLTGGGGTNSFGNIGATISWTGTAPGTTTIERVTGVASTSTDPAYTGKQSIKRYFDVASTFNSGLNGTLVFKYADSELGGQDESTLQLWRSPDGGSTWRKQGGTVNTAANTVTKSGILNFSRWTASDAANPLGPPYIEWTAQAIAKTSGDGQSGGVNTVLPSPFVITVTDGYGNPIGGTSVTFSITGVPGGASGHSLTVNSAVTGANGQASTFLQLGSVAGTYTVSATSGSLSGSPITFTATSTAVVVRVPTSMVQVAGNNQLDTVGRQFTQAMVVRILDQLGDPYTGSTVNFAVTPPQGSSGHSLTNSVATTNASGQASTVLKLGSKPGIYTVVATSPALSGASITFNATAVAGRPEYITRTSGHGQSDTVKKTLAQPFVVTATDTFANPLQGVSVRFAITSTPPAATGQRLTDSIATTDALGKAATVLTLGDSVGIYEVMATSASLPGKSATFIANATSGKAAPQPNSISFTAGNNQSDTVATTLANPMVVTVFDQYGAPYAGATVTFRVASGDPFASLTKTTTITDATGQASTVLTLGRKAGTYTVEASSGLLIGSPVRFTATAVAGRAAFLAQTSGNNQTGQINTPLPNPFTVTVTDTFGNAKQGLDVLFTIDSIPAGATGQTLSRTSVTTDAQGLAISTLTLGDSVGIYKVTATSAGLSGSPVTFIATAVTEPVRVPTVIAMTSGPNQIDTVGQRLPDSLVVTVFDQFGAMYAGATVKFAIDRTQSADAFAGLTDTLTTTDASGRAFTKLTLGHKVGDYFVRATVANVRDTIRFKATAVAGRPVSLAKTSGDNQTRPIKSQLTDLFTVTVTDTFGNAKQNVSVQFAIDSVPSNATGQTLTSVQNITDASGRATARLTLGDKVGTYSVTATSINLIGSPATFTATATVGAAKSLVMRSGNDQKALVRTTLAESLAVRVFDEGTNPVPNTTVTFAIDSLPVGATGQALNRTSVVTDTGGFASTVLTLGDKAGVYRVNATVSGADTVFFRETAELPGGAVRIAYTSGRDQTAKILTQPTNPITVTVFNAAGAPIAGTTVTFAVDSTPPNATGADVIEKSVTTNALGQASTAVKLGDKVGVYKFTASAAGLSDSPVEFRMTATYGAAARMAYVQGSRQTQTINTTLDTAFVVRITDVGGNPVPGVAVEFKIDSVPSNAVGQNLALIKPVTDSLGEASARLTLGNKANVYYASASAIGLTDRVQFTARATASIARTIALESGSGQREFISSELGMPFVVVVTDVGGNAVSGASVQFAITGKPTDASGERLREVNTITNTDGRAAAYLTLGNVVGEYTVAATSTGLTGSPISFIATATKLISEVNQTDRELNIADLTTLIDHVNMKIPPLTGLDSARVDIDKNGSLSVNDVQMLRNKLLEIPVSTESASLGSTTALKLSGSGLTTFGSDTTEIKGVFRLTENGVRFSLMNKVPVKGLQLVVKLNKAVNVDRPDIIFERAKMHSFYINSQGTELRIVAYNLANIPIEPADSGDLFRLPLRITDINEIAGGEVFVSKGDNEVLADRTSKGLVEKKVVDPDVLPRNFVLYQNYPNPFNSQTTIRYDVMDIPNGAARVLVQVYNLTGEKIKTLFAGDRVAGSYTVVWDGTDDRGSKVSSGTYYYRLVSGSYQSAKKMILIK